MRILVITACVAVVGLLLANCTSTNPSTSASSGGGSAAATSAASSSSTGIVDHTAADAIIDGFCHAIVDPYCAADQICSAKDPFCQCNPYPTPENIFWFCSKDGLRDEVRTALETGQTKFDQPQFDACLARFKAMAADVPGGPACTEPPNILLWTVCLNSFKGQLAPGEPCGNWGPPNGDYAAFLCKDGTCYNGVCVAHLKVGDPCPVPLTVTDFGPGMTCNWHQEEWCMGPPPSGGFGGGGGSGGDDAGPTQTMGICAPDGQLGDPCYAGSSPRQCKSRVCDAMTNTCVAPASGRACASF